MDFFRTPIRHNYPLGKTVANMFALFSQLSQIPCLSGDANRFCKESSVYLQFKNVTDGHTDGKAISIAIAINYRPLKQARPNIYLVNYLYVGDNVFLTMIQPDQKHMAPDVQVLPVNIAGAYSRYI